MYERGRVQGESESAGEEDRGERERGRGTGQSVREREELGDGVGWLPRKGLRMVEGLEDIEDLGQLERGREMARRWVWFHKRVKLEDHRYPP